MKKISLLLIIFALFIINNNLFSKNIYLFSRTTFSNSQFWEKQVNKDDSDNYRRVFSNYFTGSAGIGIEMIIWDIGKKRGSRLFFKGGVDLIFAGSHFVGSYYTGSPYKSINDYTFYPVNINGGAFYIGVDWDFFIGGTLPKTDLIWGFGCIWNFLFPVYSPKYNVDNFVEKYAFYATPCVLFGYDIFIPKSKLKITPQTRIGFTCNPLIPDDIIRYTGVTDGDYIPTNLYSGIYIDISVAFSFFTFQWRE